MVDPIDPVPVASLNEPRLGNLSSGIHSTTRASSTHTMLKPASDRKKENAVSSPPSESVVETETKCPDCLRTEHSGVGVCLAKKCSAATGLDIVLAPVALSGSRGSHGYNSDQLMTGRHRRVAAMIDLRARM